jgi:hypothetical protein
MSASIPGSAQQEPLTEDQAFQLGVEAYIYGYPLVVMDSVRRVGTNVAVPQGKLAPAGQFAHFRSFPDASKRDIAGPMSILCIHLRGWIFRGVPMFSTSPRQTIVIT